MNVAGNWNDLTSAPTDAAPPSTNDIAQWDGTLPSPGGSYTLGVSTSWLGIVITSPTAAVTVGGDSANSLTLGTSGIDMSAATQNLTLSDPLVVGGTETWNVATGRILTASGTLNLNSQALTVQGAGYESFTGVVSGGGALTMSGTGTLSLTKANSFSAGTTINSGEVILTLNNSGGSSTITMNGGTISIGGAGTSANTNSFVIPTGDTAAITGGGTEEIGGSTITGGGTLDVNFGSGATFDITSRNIFTGFTGTIEMGSSVGTIREGNGSASGSFGTAIIDMGTATATFNSKAGGTDALGSLAGGASTVVTGATTAGDKTTFQISAGSTVFSGSLTDGSGSSTSTTALAITGGTQVLAGATNTFSGGTTITSPGILQIGNGGTTGSIGSGAVADNGSLVFDPGATGAFTIAPAISGSGTITHSGTGLTTLTGNNSYSGGTNINSGTLQGDNTTSAMGTGTVTVSSPGAIGGVGTITAALTVNSGGIIAPGDAGVNHGTGVGVGTLTVSSATISSGSILNYDFSVLGNDLLNVATSGGLTVNGGGINLYQAGTTQPFTTNGTYDILEEAGGYSGTVTNLLSILNAQSGLTYAWNTSGNFITLTIGGGGSTSVWANSSGSSWATSGNWTGGLPNSVGAAASFGASPGLTAPGTVTLDGNETVGTIVFNNNVGGNGITTYTISQGSGGTLFLANTGSSNASITDTSGTHIISAPVSLTSSLAVSVNNATDALTISGPISGAGGLSMGGAGTLTLGGTDSYSGNTSVGSGTLIFTGNNTAVPGATSITLGAFVQVGNGGASGTLPAGAVTDNGTLTFNLAGINNISNAISGSGNVIVTGTGTLSLAATNSYSGGTSVNGGTLQIAASGTIGTGGVGVATGAVLDLNGNNLSIPSISGAGSIDDVSAGGSPTLTISGTNSTTFSGAIKNTSGTLNIVKSGSSTLTLSGASTYSGTTTITAGSIKVATGGSLNAAGPIDIDSIDGLLLGSGVTVSNPIVVSPGANEFVNVPDSGVTATLASNVTVSNTPNSGSQLRLGISGTGSTLTVTGNENAASAFAILTRGTLVFAGSGSLSCTAASDFLIARSGALNLTLENTSSINAVSADVGGGQTTAGNFNMTIQDSANFDITGVFNLCDVSTASTTDVINLNGGTLSANSFTKTSGDSTTLNLNGGTLAANSSSTSFLPALTGLTVNAGTNGAIINDNGNAITIAAIIGSGATPDGGVTKNDSGTVTLSGAETYNGNTNVNTGTLVLDFPGSIAASNNVTVAANAVMNLNGVLTGAPSVIANGSIVVGNNNTTASPFLRTWNALNIGAAGSVNLSNSSATGSPNVNTNRTVLAVSALTIASGGALNVGANDVIVHSGANGEAAFGTVTTAGTIAQEVAQGRGTNGLWAGTGITSSAANASPSNMAVAVVINDTNQTGSGQLNGPNGLNLPNSQPFSTFDNQPVSDGDVLIKYTYYGDALLTGSVTAADYGQIDNGFNMHLTGWYNGDFNYDGVINGDDYTLIDNAFNTQGTTSFSGISAGPANMIAANTGQIAGAASSAVPEPTTLSLLSIAALGMMGRRKRKSR